MPRAMLCGSDAEALRGKLLGGGDGEGEIAELMASDERRDDLHLLAQDTQSEIGFPCG